MTQITEKKLRNLTSKLIPFDLNQQSGLTIFMTSYALNMYENIERTYEKEEVKRLIISLTAMPRPRDALVKKGAMDHYVQAVGAFEIEYRVHSGQVHIFQIGLNPSVSTARAKLEKPGLYLVKKDGNGIWKRDKIATSKVETKYAAVNGMKNDLSKASWLMGDHLSKQFTGESVTEYTLYHNPSEGGGRDFLESLGDKLGMTRTVTKGFSKILVDGQEAGKPIKWVAHSQGGIIFSEAVRYYLNGMSSMGVAGRFGKNKNGLNNHSVCFHAGGNNIMRSNLLCDRAGIEVYEPRFNRFDIVAQFAGGNAFTNQDWVGLFGSVVYSNHVFGGSANQSPHTTAAVGTTPWYDEMLYGPGKGQNSVQNEFKKRRSALDKMQKSIQKVSRFSGVNKVVTTGALTTGIAMETSGGVIAEVYNQAGRGVKAIMNYLQ